MAKTFEEIDRLTMDIISGSMYSLNFLRNISVAIFDQKIEDMTVREFHAVWLKKAKYTKHYVPYCLGSIFGYLYCGILLGPTKVVRPLARRFDKGCASRMGVCWC